MPHEKSLNVVRTLGPEQHRYTIALVGHDDRAFLGRLHVLGEIGSHLALTCNFHSFTSSPAIKSRFPSFTPIACIWTSLGGRLWPTVRRQNPGISKISRTSAAAGAR